MDKNVAGQKWEVFAFNTTTNLPVTGDAANITANLRKDWGAAAAIADTNPTETEDGNYTFDLTQAETNADVLSLYPESATANVVVIARNSPIYTTTTAVGAGSYAVSVYVKDASSNPLDGAEVWITSDAAGTNVVAGSLTTDSNGLASFMLDAGTYYVWRQLAGYDFTNPQAITVSAAASFTHADGVASSAGAAGEDVTTNLETARLNVSKRIVEITANPKPSYTVNGQTVKWSDYHKMLLDLYRTLNQAIAEGEADAEPFEITSQGII